MAVPQEKRTKPTFDLLINARKLYKYTQLICSNQKKFDPKYRQLINMLVETTIMIYAKINMANGIRVKTREDYESRRAYQNIALAQINNLISIVQLSHKVFHINERRIIYWTSLIIPVKQKLISWMDSDVRRFYKQLYCDEVI